MGRVPPTRTDGVLPMKISTVLACSLCFFSLAALAGSAPGWETPFEESGGSRTPTTDETIAWLEDLCAETPLLEAGVFGSSGRGRPLQVVVADAHGRFDPTAHADRSDHTVLLVEACIHAGETCGKDAGMMLLRDIAENRGGARDLLEKVTLVFIPIFNVDGHDRFGPYNRVNQNGPEEMGWRVTSRNQNLNRDFMKADTPEMRAYVRAKYELVAKACPDFIWVDDDIRMHHHGVAFGCFCPTCLAQFAHGLYQ